MGLRTLPARLATVDTRKVPTLQTKAGATEMERGRGWMEKRHRVAKAHGYRCAKCGKVWVSSRDHIDHIVPREQGGSNDESNLQPLCNEPCHAEKTAAEAAARVGKYATGGVVQGGTYIVGESASGYPAELTRRAGRGAGKV